MIKSRYKPVYFNIAKEIASLSYAKRLKVGAIAVKDNKIISMGFNGDLPGGDNICEDKRYRFDSVDENDFELETKREIVHAEMNLLHKLAKSHESGDGAVVFCTHSPCFECAKGIIMSGIKGFFYENDYRSNDGLELLKKNGVYVEKRFDNIAE
jgi:dCMP deaminase